MSSSDDLILWSDGTWCFGYELHDEMTHMSDDYEVIPCGSDRYNTFVGEG